MASPVEIVLGRLEGVARTGKTFKALCPAHNDKSPSLSVKEGDDGRVLLHCFGGCPIEAVLAGMGLKMLDLFIANVNQRQAPKIRGVSTRELKVATKNERQILYIVQADLKVGRGISQSDLKRADRVLNRISKARRLL